MPGQQLVCSFEKLDKSSMEDILCTHWDELADLGNNGTNNRPDRLVTCSNLECRLSCIDRAIGNCDTTHDFYVNFDKQTLRASYRGLCADTTAANNALTGCADAVAAALSVCSVYGESKMEQYLKSGNGALYKQTVCSALHSLTVCMHVSPTGSCTSTYADFVNTLIKTRVTFATCGHPTTNQWFQDYSGPVNITGLTCGVSGVAPSTPFLAAMACFVALIKYMLTYSIV